MKNKLSFQGSVGVVYTIFKNWIILIYSLQKICHVYSRTVGLAYLWWNYFDASYKKSKISKFVNLCSHKYVRYSILRKQCPHFRVTWLDLRLQPKISTPRYTYCQSRKIPGWSCLPENFFNNAKGDTYNMWTYGTDDIICLGHMYTHIIFFACLFRGFDHSLHYIPCRCHAPRAGIFSSSKVHIFKLTCLI